MPYWFTRVQHLKAEALLWSKRWKEWGRPCHGEIAECMRRARHAYHYEVEMSKQLETSNLQYSFKGGHSTTTCCMTLKEVATYYMNRDSSVYACFIDASKAFDRVRYDKLFELLLGRGIPHVAVRLLMDMYSRQSTRATWDSMYSKYFGSKNGVRQGGVASPVLFTIYMDELLMRLQRAGIGCYVGHEWFGALGYADDLTLLSPSIKGWQKMVKMCAKFGREFSIKYNPGKSKYMVLSRCRKDMAHVNIVLGFKSLMWVDSVKCLGNFISTNLAEEPDIRKKQSDLISRINSLLYKFGYTDSQVLMKLFVSKCCHFYGCESWNFNQVVLERIMITWNNVVRRIMGLAAGQQDHASCWAK